MPIEPICQLLLPRCRTAADAIAFRNRYCAIADHPGIVVVDLTCIDRRRPELLLLGVLLNLRRHFPHPATVYLLNYPHYLPSLLTICKVDNLFDFLEHTALLGDMDAAVNGSS